MIVTSNPGFDFDAWVLTADHGKQPVEHAEKKKLFAQGDVADSVFYLRRGSIKLTVVSEQGKEGVLAILDAGSFVGEGCLAGQSRRMVTATTIEKCSLFRFEKHAMARLLRSEPRFAEAFTRYLLSRSIRIEEDLVDQLFNTSEKRLARILLLLAQVGKADKPRPIFPKLSQETLAAMVGTTRPRVNYFMTKFRRMGYIKYNGTLEVKNSLINIILHE
jgi:CRP/FNR family transcriptional regulator, cyclic AMP receptor protein